MTTTDYALTGAEWLSRMQTASALPLSLSSPPAASRSTIKKATLEIADGSTTLEIADTAEPPISSTMDRDKPIMKITKQLETSLSEIPWTRTIAAGSLVVGALLLITGRRKSALAVSAAGAAVALLENPDIVREAWASMPRVVRAGQDFLVRIEDFVEELNKQGVRVRKVLAGD
ncbi:MAG: hypothetical protein WA891_19065 [Acidobacteriaceae bacterium]